MSYTPNEIILPRNVEEEVKESYLRYSMSVIISRALPDVRDGLKPSQRRILYAMRQLNLTPGAKHRKCAKISGDTSGDYHPHGETVIYPTLVRMAQSWAMRYPLIDGQGNYGSVDGDPPAAMRYTEARLTHASMALMEDLEKETVDFVPNYDETKTEPTVFPAKLPNLLLNGSSGIAVGMATNIPPHNFLELLRATELLIENPKTSIDEIMEVMPGPDFPTGGLICGYRGIKEAYHTGRGKIILRGLMDVEQQDSSDRKRIVVTEIPYNVNKATLIQKIAQLINDKIIDGISDIRDESDKDGLRIVIELKRGELPDVIINQLYKLTEMQVTFGCNMLALDKGLPRTMNIKQFIQAWIEHRIDVIRRRTRFELAKAEARAHILEGYLKALDHLDDVVKIIRKSLSREDAKTQLMVNYSLTDKQANAVLDLRLYQLTSLEKEKIENEYKELLEKIAHFRSILASENLVRDIIKHELDDLKKKHSDDRKTKITAAEGEFNIEDLIADEQVMITISEDDYIKRMPISFFREQRRGGHGVIGMDMKKEDLLKDIYVASTHDYLLFFTSLGRCYWLKAWQIPEAARRTKGKPLINLLEGLHSGERVAAMLCVRNFEEEGTSILLATKNGVIKKTWLNAFSSPRRKGVYAINIDENDEVIAARLCKEGEEVMLFTRQGMAVRFNQSEARPLGRVARGVRGVTLKGKEDAVVSCEIIKGENDTLLIVCERGFGKRSKVADFRKTRRGGVGVRSIITSKRNGFVVAAINVINEDSVVLMSKSGQTLRMSMKDLRVMGRSTQGVRLVHLKEEDLLVAVQKLRFIEEEKE